MNLAVTDRGQGDQGHIHGITRAPSLDDHIPGGSCTEQEEGQDYGEDQMVFTFHFFALTEKRAGRTDF